MKKLDLKQMEKVNGGHSDRRCARIMSRSMRHACRGDLAGGDRLNDLYDEHC